MKKRILVTGGTGYIGSHTVVELQNSGYEVVIVDNLSNSRADVVDNIEQITGVRPAFEKVDCLDYEGMDAVFTKYSGIEGIIHFAASKAVGESVQKPLLYYRNNIVSLINILELMPKHGVKGIIFSSSCTVYGQPLLQSKKQNHHMVILSRLMRKSLTIQLLQVLLLRLSSFVISILLVHILQRLSVNCQ